MASKMSGGVDVGYEGVTDDTGFTGGETEGIQSNLPDVGRGFADACDGAVNDGIEKVVHTEFMEYGVDIAVEVADNGHG